MSLFRVFRPTVEVELLSADLLRTLEAMRKAAIVIEQSIWLDEFRLRFCIRGRDLAILRRLTEKRGDRLTVCRYRGVYYDCLALAKRPILVLGILLLTALSLWLPTRVLFVEVEGNAAVPEAQIVEAAATCGLGFGTSRRAVRSEKVKNALLAAMPQLQWVGVNTYGCRAVITVRERNEEPSAQERLRVASIVALRDGIVRDMTVLRGNALCVPGQAVKAGEVLISAYIDCGICIRATQAQGEIFGDTRRVLRVYMPTNCERRTQTTATAEHYSLIVGKKRINFRKKGGISDSTCAKIYEQVRLTLPGGFELPIAISRERCYDYDTQTCSTQSDDSRLSDFAAAYLYTHMSAGKITATNEHFVYEDGRTVLTGIYDCYELIGILKPEEYLNA